LKRLYILLFIGLVADIQCQQPVYTRLYNVPYTGDYALKSFVFDSRFYIYRHTSFREDFIELNTRGDSLRGFLIPKIKKGRGYFDAFTAEDKLFLLGITYDTARLERGNVTIIDRNWNILKDTFYTNHPSMWFSCGVADTVRKRIILLYNFQRHVDSFEYVHWGIVEIDSSGNLIRQSDMPDVNISTWAESILYTRDGNYFIAGKQTLPSGRQIPFFQKLDTSFQRIWITNLDSIQMTFYTDRNHLQNVLELPDQSGFVYLGMIRTGFHNDCNFYDSYSALIFMDENGKMTRYYYHNYPSIKCESAHPKGLFFKNDSILMIFSQRDTTKFKEQTDSSSSDVLYYHLHQNKVVKQIIGGYTFWGKIPRATLSFDRLHVARDLDGGYLTVGDICVQGDGLCNGTAVYKTDSCGYTDDHQCKLVYSKGSQNGMEVDFHIIDSMSILCQPLWTIEGRSYTQPDIVHSFSRAGWHKIRLWGFAGKTTDSISFDIYLDSMPNTLIATSLPDLHIYPNPAQTVLNLKLPRFQEGLEYKLYNSIGVGIIHNKFSRIHTQIDISRIPGGVYTLIISNFQGDILSREQIQISR